MLICQGLERPQNANGRRTGILPPKVTTPYRKARRLVVVLLAARLEERHSRAGALLLPIAARLANATLTPERRLATPHLLRFLICLDELEAAERIDSDLATELWQAAAEVHSALQKALHTTP